MIHLSHFRFQIYTMQKLFLWLVLSTHVYVLASQDQHTLPKQNILFQSCYYGLFIYLCIGILGPEHPPKVKYSLSKLLLWLVHIDLSRSRLFLIGYESYHLKLKTRSITCHGKVDCISVKSGSTNFFFYQSHTPVSVPLRCSSLAGTLSYLYV